MGNERLVGHFVSVLIVGLVTLAGAAGAQPAGGDPERGERVFRAECAMCHGSDARGMMGMHPSLRGAVERARAMLDRRYAAGELNREEYLERRRDLDA